jgi:hypothetical protein
VAVLRGYRRTFSTVEDGLTQAEMAYFSGNREAFLARCAAARSERGTRAESAPTEPGTAAFLRVPSDERLYGHRPMPGGDAKGDRRTY